MSTIINVLITVLSITTLVSLSLAAFFVKELLKKFGHMGKFIQASNQMVVWNYNNPTKKPRGMRNIVLRSTKGKYFTVLLGFELNILGRSVFDYYGVVHSDAQGVATFSTYLGRGNARFMFFVNSDLGFNPIKVSSTETDQDLIPSEVYPPHFFQRLGFFG